MNIHAKAKSNDLSMSGVQYKYSILRFAFINYEGKTHLQSVILTVILMSTEDCVFSPLLVEEYQ